MKNTFLYFLRFPRLVTPESPELRPCFCVRSEPDTAGLDDFIEWLSTNVPKLAKMTEALMLATWHQLNILGDCLRGAGQYMDLFAA